MCLVAVAMVSSISDVEFEVMSEANRGLVMITPEFRAVGGHTVWTQPGSGFESAGAPSNVDDLASRYVYWWAVGGDQDQSIRGVVEGLMRDNPGVGAEFALAVLRGQGIEYSTYDQGTPQNNFFETPPQEFTNTVVGLLEQCLEVLSTGSRQAELEPIAEEMGQLMGAIKGGQSFVADIDPNVDKLKELMTRYHLQEDAQRKQAEMIGRVERGFVKSQEE